MSTDEQIAAARAALDQADRQLRIAQAHVRALVDAGHIVKLPGKPPTFSGEVAKRTWGSMVSAHHEARGLRADLERLTLSSPAAQTNLPTAPRRPTHRQLEEMVARDRAAGDARNNSLRNDQPITANQKESDQ